MPKLIDYPRTNYAGAWEIADVVDDTGGKCALETCARKLDRKVSGSFKAIVGSAVKFGLLTSKREMLTTTTLFRRIKHAYDKQEELIFHREAFLTPPLFTQLCRKFRSRELPVQMLDIMLIREFDVEEINAQGVAKAFTDGARMVGLLDERNIIADIDQFAAQQPPRRELASPNLIANTFRDQGTQVTQPANPAPSATDSLFGSPRQHLPSQSNVRTVTSATLESEAGNQGLSPTKADPFKPALPSQPLRGADAVANLFGLTGDNKQDQTQQPNYISPAFSEVGPDMTGQIALASVNANRPELIKTRAVPILPKDESSHTSTSMSPSNFPSDGSDTITEDLNSIRFKPLIHASISSPTAGFAPTATSHQTQNYRIELSGPGINTALEIQDEDDLALVRFLLGKIERQLRK